MLPFTVTARPWRPSTWIGVSPMVRSNSRNPALAAPADGSPCGLRAQAGRKPCKASKAAADAVLRSNCLRVIIPCSMRSTARWQHAGGRRFSF